MFFNGCGAWSWSRLRSLTLDLVPAPCYEPGPLWSHRNSFSLNIVHNHSVFSKPRYFQSYADWLIDFIRSIVCLTRVWQSLLPLFCDKTFEFSIQTWQTSLEHYYVYVQTYFLSHLRKMLILLISSYCKVCTLPTLRSRVSVCCEQYKHARSYCWQWTHFTMGPNEQNQHFAELRHKICLYIHVVVLLTCLPSLDGKLERFVTKKWQKWLPNLS